MRTMIYTMLILLLIPVMATAYPQVWIATNEWSYEWELKYAEFAEQTYEYYRQGGGAAKYLPMRKNDRGEVGAYLDCTNLIYATRAIFAYENSLPFMTSLSGYMKKENKFFDYYDIGHFSTHFSKYSQGTSRFKAFLQTLMNQAFSCTLNDDTFPIAVQPDVVLPGMVYSINPALSNGHSYLIFRVETGPEILNSAKQPVMVIGGTIPANIPLPEFYFFKQQGRLKWQGFVHHMRGGFRGWLNPVKVNGKWKLEVPEYAKKWFSEEQYEKRFVLIQRIIKERFKVGKLPEEERFRGGLSAISYSLVKRVNIINDGHRKWVKMGRPSVLSKEVLYDLGTVNTDRRLSFQVREVFQVTMTDEEKMAVLNEYVFDISGHGDYVLMGDIMQGFKDDTLSHSPADPSHVRWGLSPDKKPLTKDEIFGLTILPDYQFSPVGSFRKGLQSAEPEFTISAETESVELIHDEKQKENLLRVYRLGTEKKSKSIFK